MLMIAGEFDLSVGSMVGAASMLVAICTGYLDLNPWIGVGVAYAASVLIGLGNGFIVVRTRLPSFIVTLAAERRVLIAGVEIEERDLRVIALADIALGDGERRRDSAVGRIDRRLQQRTGGRRAQADRLRMVAMQPGGGADADRIGIDVLGPRWCQKAQCRHR